MKKIMLLCLCMLAGLLHLSAQPAFPGTVIATSPDPQTITIPSPSLVVLPDSSYIASHDLDKTTSAIYRSADRGETWTLIAEVDSSHWSTLFWHNGALYLMGAVRSYSNINIHRSDDGGFTWTTPTNQNNGVLLTGRFHTAPVPVVRHSGRIWRAYEEGTDVDGTWEYGAFMFSAPDTADLLKASSWTRTNIVYFEDRWLNARNPRWREGNAVVTPSGNIANIIRFETAPSSTDTWEIQGAAAGKERYYVAARLDVNSAGTTISFDTTGPGYINFPGPESKFTIRYDSVSGKYWSMVNKITSVHKSSGVFNNPYRQRNVVMLISSTDLVNWTENCKVLRWDEGRVTDDSDRIAFQYLDWQFDGNDIVAVSRTAWYGRRYHDANLMTFHRFAGFRTLTMDDSAEDLALITRNYNQLAAWQFTSPAAAGTETSYNASVVNAGGVVLPLARGPGLIPGSLQRSFNSTFSSWGTPGGSKDSALAKGHYYQFAICAKTGYELNLSGIEIKLRRNTAGPTSYGWYYSRDGVNFTQAGADVTGFTDNNTNGVIRPPLSLSDVPSLQQLQAGDSVWIRLYAWNASASNGNLAIGRYDTGDTTHSLQIYGQLLPLASTDTLMAWQFGEPATLGLETCYTATTNDPRLKLSVLSRGAGFKPTTFGRSFISLTTSFTAPDNTKTQALANHEYYEFTVEPRTGYTVSLSSLNVRLRRNSKGCAAYRWRYSVDGGASFTELGAADIPFTDLNTEGAVQPAISLTGVAALQNIAGGSKVIFRLYAWGATDANGNFGIGRYPVADETPGLILKGSMEKAVPPFAARF